ncbi:hypothetical protein [Sphingopyxis sp.]|uniref:hypothetical protein n=1 Tax=Sphingopyxis sp. TaxID=1908224 RepID=UPI002B46CF0C|nr:hypothetical protein [Sphingopyxis sp.]HJS12320.1 hypothetical protein [Sphingopyxis sp.]
MITYALRYEDDGIGIEKRVEFEADTPAQALLIAQGEAEGRWAELSADGRPICLLGRENLGAGNYWIIRPQQHREIATLDSAPSNAERAV